MNKIKRMQAAILTQLHQELIIDEVSLPDKLDYGQVLVEVCYSGICGSQIGEIDGVKGPDKYLPHLLGHEGSGRVLKTGPGVQYVRPADTVVMHWRRGNGIEALPPQYKWRGRKLNAGYVTTFNQYAIVSENRLTPIPKEFDLKIAPLLGCAVTTGLGVVANNAKLKMGESIVVFGIGGVGLCVIQGAAMTSAHPIIAVDLYDNKLQMAKQFGATHLVNSSRDNPAEEIHKLLNMQGADIVVDNTGIPQIISLAYTLTQPTGRTVLVGVPHVRNDVSIHTLALHFGKTLSGSHGGESNPSVDIPKYIRLYQAGKLELEKLITNQYSLSQINFAIDQMRNAQIAGRCVIKIGER